MGYIIKKGKKIVHRTRSSTDVMGWLLRNQGNSIDYALRHGGYSIRKSPKRR